MKLLQELFANGILSESRVEDLEKEIKKTGKTEEVLILEQKIISENALFELKSKIYGIPLKSVKPEEVPADVLELIPEEAGTNYKMAALSKGENFVQIGMVYTEDISAQNALRFLANQEKFNYQVYLITLSTLNNLLKQRKSIGAETKKALEELSKEKGEILDALSNDSLNKNSKTEKITEDAPVIKMVQVLLRHAIEGRASD